MTDYAGSCHCGAVGYCYTTELMPPEWSIRACQCRFCRMHDALSTSDPEGELGFFCNDSDALRRYRFALKTADFLLCRNCGVYVGAVIDVSGNHYGIINTHALQTAPEDMAKVGAVSYDSEDVASRVSRREERWTPVRELPAGA